MGIRPATLQAVRIYLTWALQSSRALYLRGGISGLWGLSEKVSLTSAYEQLVGCDSRHRQSKCHI